MTRDVDAAQDLFSEMLGAVCRDTGLREDLARQYVAPILHFLQQNYGGRRVYIPMPERRYPELEIAAYYEKARAEEAAGGVNAVKATCRKFNLGRTKLFEIVKPYRSEGSAESPNGG